MNRGEIREKILWRLNQDTDDSQFWEENYINDLIDEAYMNFASRTFILETSATLSLIAYQHLYPFATDCFIVNRVYHSTSEKIIEPITWQELVNRDPCWNSTTSTSPNNWVFIPPNKMFIYPPVTTGETDTITYYYTKLPSDLANDAAGPDIPNIFHDALIEYVLTIALLRVGTMNYMKKSFGYWNKYKEKIQSAKKVVHGRSPRQIRIRARF
jgi:hypothetical protein